MSKKPARTKSHSSSYSSRSNHTLEHLSKNPFVIAVVIIVIIGAIWATVQVVGQNQDIRQHATSCPAPACSLGQTKCQQYTTSPYGNTGYKCTCQAIANANCVNNSQFVWSCNTRDLIACPTSGTGGTPAPTSGNGGGGTTGGGGTGTLRCTTGYTSCVGKLASSFLKLQDSNGVYTCYQCAVRSVVSYNVNCYLFGPVSLSKCGL